MTTDKRCGTCLWVRMDIMRVWCVAPTPFWTPENPGWAYVKVDDGTNCDCWEEERDDTD